MPDFRDKYWYRDVREVNNFSELILDSAVKMQNSPAFWVKKERGGAYIPISYNLLKHDIESIGLKLKAMGLLKKHIAVMGVNAYEWIVTYIAVAIGGGVVVPLDKEFDENEVKNLIQTANCSTIFYTSDQHDKIEKIEGIDVRVVMNLYNDRTDINIPVADTITADELKYETSYGGEIYAWKTLLSEGEALAEKDNTFFDTPTDPDAMSILLFTSGTTGDPKGVMISQTNVLSDIMDTCRIANIHTTDRHLSILPIHHTYECTFGMMLILYRGASAAFFEGLKYITANMKEIHNTVLISVPLVNEMIYRKIWKSAEKSGKAELLKKTIKRNNRLKAIGIDMSRVLFRRIHKELGGKLRIVITGAAAISPNVFRGFEDLGITVLQGYGLTECSPLVSGTPQAAKERYKKAGSVGVVVRSGEIRVDNKDENGIGEIWYRGPNLMQGYYNMPEETEKIIVDGWFNTGDRGFVDKDGWLYLTGRTKNIILTKTGKNIYPEEIEELVNAHPYISECMVYESKSTDDAMVAIQILPDLEEIKEALGEIPPIEEQQRMFKEIINEINMTMPSYKRIKSVIVREDDFIRTTTRKIKRLDNIAQIEGFLS